MENILITDLVSQKRFSHKEKNRAVIFDFDGTVVDTMPFLTELAAKLMVENYNISKNAAQKRYLETSGVHFPSQIELIFPDHPKNQDVANTFESMKQEGIFAHPVFPEVIPTVRYFANKKLKLLLAAVHHRRLLKDTLRQTNFTICLMGSSVINRILEKVSRLISSFNIGNYSLKKYSLLVIP